MNSTSGRHGRLLVVTTHDSSRSDPLHQSSDPLPRRRPPTRRRRTSWKRSWRRSSSACAPRRRSPAPQPPAPCSAASSQTAPSSAATANATHLPSLGSSTNTAFTLLRRPTPPPRSPAPSPALPISHTPSSLTPAMATIGDPATSVTAASSSTMDPGAPCSQTLRFAIHCRGATLCFRPYLWTNEGALEMFYFADEDEYTPNGYFDIYHTTRQNKGESSKDWQLENINSIPLPRQQHGYFTIGADEGFLLLGAIAEDQLDVDEESAVSLSRPDWTLDYFSLEVRTSQLMKVCKRKKPVSDGQPVYWYFGYPPSLSKPSI